MARQLVLLLPSELDWRLDEPTKELGRRGVSEARAALDRVTPATPARVGAAR